MLHEETILSSHGSALQMHHVEPVRMEFFDGYNEKDAEAAYKEHNNSVVDVF